MRILFKKSFKKGYKGLQLRVRDAFNERLDLFTENNFHLLLNNHSLHGEYDGCRSINITGDIRAIYYRDCDTATFIRIGTHSELYE